MPIGFYGHDLCDFEFVFVGTSHSDLNVSNFVCSTPELKGFTLFKYPIGVELSDNSGVTIVVNGIVLYSYILFLQRYYLFLKKQN